MGEVVYRGKVRIRRDQPPLREAHLLASDEHVTFGVPGEVGAHYGFAEGQVALHAGTLDYIVAAAGG